MDINKLLQQRGMIAKRIADEGLNIHVDITNPLVKEYNSLKEQINSFYSKLIYMDTDSIHTEK